jgi:hypothetical protein
MSSETMRQIEEVLEKAPESRHSYFQLKYFVLGKEPTVQAQMWQALRELQSRKETIESLETSIEDTVDNIAMLDVQRDKDKYIIFSSFQMPELPQEVKTKEWAIKERQYARQKDTLKKMLKQLEKKLQFAWQEARFFLQAFNGLNKIEPLKDYDDLESQKEYWNERVAQHINLKMLLQQPLDTEIVQTALALHDDAPIKIQTIQTLKHIEGQMNKLKEKYVAQIKEKDAITQTNNES